MKKVELEFAVDQKLCGHGSERLLQYELEARSLAYLSCGHEVVGDCVARRSMEGLDAMWHYAQCFRFNVVLDDLHLARDEMTVVPCVADG